jgi:serine/threonine protein kinase
VLEFNSLSLRAPRCAVPCLLQRVPWNKKFSEADPLALDLLDKMLQFDPRKRIDVQAALKHPWLAQLHDEAAEPSAPGEQLQLLLSCSCVRGFEGGDCCGSFRRISCIVAISFGSVHWQHPF